MEYCDRRLTVSAPEAPLSSGIQNGTLGETHYAEDSECAQILQLSLRPFAGSGCASCAPEPLTAGLTDAAKATSSSVRRKPLRRESPEGGRTIVELQIPVEGGELRMIPVTYRTTTRASPRTRKSRLCRRVVWAAALSFALISGVTLLMLYTLSGRQKKPPSTGLCATSVVSHILAIITTMPLTLRSFRFLCAHMKSICRGRGRREQCKRCQDTLSDPIQTDCLPATSVNEPSSNIQPYQLPEPLMWEPQLPEAQQLTLYQNISERATPTSGECQGETCEFQMPSGHEKSPERASPRKAEGLETADPSLPAGYEYISGEASTRTREESQRS